MYIRLAQGNVDPSKLDDYLAYVRTELPILTQQAGFRNAYHAVNREKSRSVILSTWDTEEHATSKPNPEGMARLQGLGLQPEGAVVFEVTDQI